MSKSIPGPTFKLDNSLPCGCRIARDEGTLKYRLWYCPTHAAAFEVLEALRFNLDALNTVLRRVPEDDDDAGVARVAEMRARSAIRRATSGV
jgi:hypothetical protein